MLWRLGEEGDFGLLGGSWPYHQHAPEWQADGTLLLYDNGVGNPNLDDALETSRAVRYAIDTDAMTVMQAWEDEAPDFVSAVAGDANRLPDGTILVTDSAVADGLGGIAGRVRQIAEVPSDPPQWQLTAGFGQLIYRASATTRIAGESE